MAERDLDDLQGQPLLVPPTGYSHVTLGLGLATTPTFKRFFMPSESWARDMWRICEALPGESGGYRDFVSMHPSEDFQDYVSRCYENLSADEVTKLAGHFGSKFAILKNRQCDLFNSVAQVSSGAESRCLVSVNPVT